MTLQNSTEIREMFGFAHPSQVKISSREVRILSRIVSQDIQSVTGRNLHSIAQLIKLNLRKDPVTSFKSKDIGYSTPEGDQGRLPFLVKLLNKSSELFT